MKINIKFLIALTFALFFIFGCGSTSPNFIPYSFVGEDPENRAATVYFERNIRLVDFEGTGFSEGQLWPAVKLPAGRSMDLRVYIYWEGDAPGTRRRGIFKCPPLESGGEYRLNFNFKSKGMFIKRPIDGYSILLEKKREPGKRSRYDKVITQVIPALSK